MEIANARQHSKPNCCGLCTVLHVTSFKQELIKFQARTYKCYKWSQTLRILFKLFILLKIPLEAGLRDRQKNLGFKEVVRVRGSNRGIK